MVSSLEVDDQDSSPRTIQPKKPPGGLYALIVLTALNGLNFVDRYIPSSTKELFKKDLNLSDAETSGPITAFIIVFMIAKPIFGMLCDKGFSRKGLIATGIVTWSLATAAAFFAIDFWTFMLCRMVVGIGEAAYASIAPSLLSDFYPPEDRNKVLTAFYIAIPVGAALGFGLGGWIGKALGWRYAFLICGLPGVFTALLILRINDPGRGIFERPTKEEYTWKQTLKVLWQNKLYVYTQLGYIMQTFALGGMGDWLPTYLSRVDNIDLAVASTVVGGATVIAGIGGAMLGGYLAEKVKGKTRQPYMAVCSVSMGISAVFCVGLLYLTKNLYGVTILLLITQGAIWCGQGPINATITNCVPFTIRARAFSFSILLIHLFGDSFSPLLIGGISDATGSLQIAVIVIPVVLALASLAWGFAWRKTAEVTPDTNESQSILQSENLRKSREQRSDSI